jgi:hypothetical protein
MTKAWRVEILDSMPDADMVLARFYYNNGVAIRFKAKADGATYSGTVAVVARRFYYRVSNGRKQVMYIAKVVPEQLTQLALILMSVRGLCDYYNLMKFIDGVKFCRVGPLDIYIICPERPWAPCL